MGRQRRIRRIRTAFGSIITAKDYPLDFELHVEFWIARQPEARGQGRGNSGIFLLGRHELQILDVYDNPQPPLQGLGAMYGVLAPTGLQILPPETWQAFDVAYRSPRTDKDGNIIREGRLSLSQNGQKVIDDARFSVASTIGELNTKVGHPGPIGLQDHGNVVRFRNLQIRPIPDTPAAAGSGWHGWPADAPPPAVAPFDAAQAQKQQQQWAAYLKIPADYTNSIGMKFVLIPPGEFLMGSTAAEIEEVLKVSVDEYKQWHKYFRSGAPQHKVVLTQPIYLGVHEVRQKEYEAITGTNPSYFSATGPGKAINMKTQNHPVEMVSWNDAAEFCTRLSQKENLRPFYIRTGETVTSADGTGYRLPTDAEWEFACRAGTTTRFWTGESEADLSAAEWFRTNAGTRTHAAGELKSNPLGLFDTHGNAWEWVHDLWDPTYYGQFADKPGIDPRGPSSTGSERVFRGGDFYSLAGVCRSQDRHATEQASRLQLIGFRVALTVDAVRQSESRKTD